MTRLQTHFTANSSYIYLFYYLAETIFNTVFYNFLLICCIFMHKDDYW